MKKTDIQEREQKWKMSKTLEKTHNFFLRDNLNAGGSAICIHKNLFPGGAVYFACHHMSGT